MAVILTVEATVKLRESHAGCWSAARRTRRTPARARQRHMMAPAARSGTTSSRPAGAVAPLLGGAC